MNLQMTGGSTALRFTGRVTACISTQAGCAMGCVFCATGQMGFTRHLTAGEIVLAGSFTKPAPAKLGDVFDADYGPLGKLQFRFV